MAADGQLERVGEIRNAYKIVVEKPERKWLLGSSWYRWEDNIKMDFSEIGWEDIDWINLAQDRDQRRVSV
jgi:hypothetical protein